MQKNGDKALAQYSKKFDKIVPESWLVPKSFLKKAPKQIVDREKKALIDYKIELKKLNSILNSIKN